MNKLIIAILTLICLTCIAKWVIDASLPSEIIGGIILAESGIAGVHQYITRNQGK